MRLNHLNRPFRANGSFSKSGQRGSALIAALWVSIALSVLVGSMIFSARTDIALVKNAKQQALETEAMLGAINLARASLPHVRNIIGRNGPTVTQSYTIGKIPVEVTISDEGGRIDLNAAPEALLLLFFEMAGAAEPRSLTDALLDWRDSNNIRRLNGAEKGDYQRTGLDYGPSNGPITSMSEVRGLLGMTDDLYQRIAPLVTLHSQQRGFDPDLAPPELLSVLMDGDLIGGVNNEVVLPLALQRFRTRSRRQVFHIETKVNGANSDRALQRIVTE